MEDILTKLNVSPIDWTTRDTAFVPGDGEIWYYYNNSAYPNTVVYLIGDGSSVIGSLPLYTTTNDQVQTFDGVKTFGDIPVLPASDPTTDNQAVRKKYVDDLDDNTVKLTGDQDVSGEKTFGDGGDNSVFPKIKITRETAGTKTQAGLDIVIGSTGNSVLSPLDSAGAEITNSQFYWDYINTRWYCQSDFVCAGSSFADIYNSTYFRSASMSVQIDPNYATTTADSLVHLFRNNNTSGNRRFRIFKGDGTATTQLECNADTGSLNITGALSKGSGSFKIDHPLPKKAETHYLVHSFVESPQADNIYSDMVFLKKGKAVINIDEHFNMTEGTFIALNRKIRRSTTNESGVAVINSKIDGNILTITAPLDNKCSDEVCWKVIGERQDKHMYDTDWTDEDGRVIVEPLRAETLSEEKARIKKEKKEYEGDNKKLKTSK